MRLPDFSVQLLVALDALGLATLAWLGYRGVRSRRSELAGRLRSAALVLALGGLALLGAAWSIPAPTAVGQGIGSVGPGGVVPRPASRDVPAGTEPMTIAAAPSPAADPTPGPAVASGMPIAIVRASATPRPSARPGPAEATRSRSPAPADPTPEETRSPSDTPVLESTPNPRPLPSASPSSAADDGAGVITFGSDYDPVDLTIVAPATDFHVGAHVAWRADFSRPPGTATVRFTLTELRPVGPSIVHWQEDIPLSNPAFTVLVNRAVLSTYAHDEPGTFVMRYLAGGTVLAVGTFIIVP